LIAIRYYSLIKQLDVWYVAVGSGTAMPQTEPCLKKLFVGLGSPGIMIRAITENSRNACGYQHVGMGLEMYWVGRRKIFRPCRRGDVP
jgi:hypothetical protein